MKLFTLWAGVEKSKQTFHSKLCQVHCKLQNDAKIIILLVPPRNMPQGWRCIGLGQQPAVISRHWEYNNSLQVQDGIYYDEMKTKNT